MKIKKLEIQKEKLGEEKIKMLVFLFNRKQSFFKERGKNSALYFSSIHKKDNHYVQLMNEYNEEIKVKGDVITDFKNDNIMEIIQKSQYEPLSFYFIKNFFSEIFYNSDVLNDFIFKRKNRSTVAWLYQEHIFDFLKYFTNIEEVIDDFVEQNKQIDEKIFFIDTYEEAQYYRFLYGYILKQKKDIYKKKEFEVISIDNQFAIIQKDKIIKQLSYTKMVYYKDFFKKGTNLFT